MTSFNSHPSSKTDWVPLRTVTIHLVDDPDGLVDEYVEVAEVIESEHYLKLIGQGGGYGVVLAAIPHHRVASWSTEVPSGLEGLSGEIAT